MPGYNEIADIDVINGNMDKIDVQMKKNADSAQQSKDIVSDEYSATNTYAVGDYCIHENVLYKCKTAITTGEAFDSNKWVQTTCGTEFGELNSNLIVLEATSTIDMTASRELDDITSSTLTIPSSYKPIAMYGYNEDNNDNISAIPLLVRSDGKVLFHAKNHSTSDQGIIHFRIRVTFKKVS